MDAKRNGDMSEEGEAEVLDASSALPALNRAEIDIQIATARRWPRSIVRFKKQAFEMATLDEDTAGSMFYVLPRDGKRIEGPSVRLAEIVASAWGNLRTGARVVEVGERYVKAQGAAFDLETNHACAVEVTRRITGRKGRYSDDMIGVVSNAACSIALRQAIFKVVPFAFVKDIYEEAKKASLGKALTMEQRRTREFEWFGKLGARPEQILKIIGRTGLADITVDDLVSLRGMRTAIQDGETTLAQVLREAEAEPTTVRPGGLSTESILGGDAKGQNDVRPGTAAEGSAPTASTASTASPGASAAGAQKLMEF